MFHPVEFTFAAHLRFAQLGASAWLILQWVEGSSRVANAAPTRLNNKASYTLHKMALKRKVAPTACTPTPCKATLGGRGSCRL